MNVTLRPSVPQRVTCS